MMNCADGFWRIQKIFSEENLRAAGIEKRFQNVDLEECIEAIEREIRGCDFL